MGFKLYPLEDTKRLDEICRLFSTGLGETMPEQWIWKHYTDNGLPKGMILVAENEIGKLGGMFAMQPAYYSCGNRRILLVQTEDLVIDSECRRQGLMRKMYDYAIEYYAKKEANALISLSTNEASYPIFIKYGAKNLGNMTLYESKKTIIPKGWIKRIYKTNDWSISVSDDIPEQLFFSKTTDVWKMEKNQRFMEWKFKDNPEQKYSWLKIEYKNELVGYMVFYVNRGRLRSAVNVCDWDLKNCVDEKILRRVVLILQSYGNWVSIWGSMSGTEERLWKAAGLGIEVKTQSHFVYHAIDKESIFNKWHITKADSDN